MYVVRLDIKTYSYLVEIKGKDLSSWVKCPLEQKSHCYKGKTKREGALAWAKDDHVWTSSHTNTKYVFSTN